MINLARFDLTSLRLFLAAAHEGSLTAAAERIPITLSAASKRLSDLEQMMECALFVRHARGLELTPAGEALRRHAEQLIHGLERMAGEMGDYAQGIRGHVRMWANASSVIQFLPQSLSGFVRKHPDIRIGLEEKLSQQIIDAVLTGQSDLGVFADSLPTQGLDVFTYRQDRLMVLVREDHPLAGEEALWLRQITAYDFVGLNLGSSLHSRISAAAMREQQVLKLRIQVSSFDAICHMVAAGLGISIMPRGVLRTRALGVGLRSIPLLDEWSTRSLLVGARSGVPLRPEARHLYDYLYHESLDAGGG